MALPEGIPFGGAQFYNAVVSGRVLAAQYKRIASTIKLEAGLVLDIGSGPGDLAIELALRNRRVNVLGIDVSAAMVKLARSKARGVPNATFRVMNATRLILPDGSVDLVVSTASMHHWLKPGLAFAEIYRVVKPGGCALIYDIRSDASRKEIFAEIPRRLSFPLKFAILWGVRHHGFTRRGLEKKIVPVLMGSPFRQGEIETAGLWYRLSLLKR